MIDSSPPALPFPRFASPHPVLCLRSTKWTKLQDKSIRRDLSGSIESMIKLEAVMVSSDLLCLLKIDSWWTSTYIYPFPRFASEHSVLWLWIIHVMEWADVSTRHPELSLLTFDNSWLWWVQIHPLVIGMDFDHSWFSICKPYVQNVSMCSVCVCTCSLVSACWIHDIQFYLYILCSPNFLLIKSSSETGVKRCVLYMVHTLLCAAVHCLATVHCLHFALCSLNIVHILQFCALHRTAQSGQNLLQWLSCHRWVYSGPRLTIYSSTVCFLNYLFHNCLFRKTIHPQGTPRIQMKRTYQKQLKDPLLNMWETKFTRQYAILCNRPTNKVFLQILPSENL